MLLHSRLHNAGERISAKVVEEDLCTDDFVKLGSCPFSEDGEWPAGHQGPSADEADIAQGPRIAEVMPTPGPGEQAHPADGFPRENKEQDASALAMGAGPVKGHHTQATCSENQPSSLRVATDATVEDETCEVLDRTDAGVDQQSAPYKPEQQLVASALDDLKVSELLGNHVCGIVH